MPAECITFDSMELFDLYDKNRVPLGLTLERGKPMPEGCFHIVVHACIFNSRGELLIQQRQPFKKGWPGKWDLSCGGCAISGEDSRTAMERELKEELGLEISLEGIRPAMTVNFNTGFDDIYTITRDMNLADLHLQAEEVNAVQWAPIEQVLAMIDEDIFVPYHKDLIRFLFYMRNHKGALLYGER